MLFSTIATRQDASGAQKSDANQFPNTQDSADNKQAVELERLLAIITNLDFSTVTKASTQEHQVLDILQNLFPQIAKDKLIQIEASVCARMEKNAKHLSAMNTSDTNTFFIKLSLSIAASVASFYLGGTLAAKGSELLITKAYTILFGTPNPESVAYSLLVPVKKFVTSLAQEYGGYAIGIVAGPVVYNVSGLGMFLCKKAAFLTRLMAKKPQMHLAMSLKDPSAFSNVNIEEIIADFEMLVISSESPFREDTTETEDILVGGQPCCICHNYRGKREALAQEKIQNAPLPHHDMSKLSFNA